MAIQTAQIARPIRTVNGNIDIRATDNLGTVIETAGGVRQCVLDSDVDQIEPGFSVAIAQEANGDLQLSSPQGIDGVTSLPFRWSIVHAIAKSDGRWAVYAAIAAAATFSTGTIQYHAAQKLGIVNEGGQDWLCYRRGLSFGDSGSGGETSDPRLEALFKLLWNSSEIPLGGGATKTNANDDWSNKRRLELPPPEGRLLGLTGSGRNTAEDVGSDSTVLVTANIPAHNHNANPHAHAFGAYVYSGAGGSHNWAISGGGNNLASLGGTTANASVSIGFNGSGQSFSLVQKSLYIAGTILLAL